MTMTAGTLSLCLALAAPGLILLVVAFRALLRTAGTRRSRNGALRPAARARLVPIRHRVRLDAFSRDIGIAPLLIARLIPIMSFNLINYAAGLAGVPRWTFIWTTRLTEGGHKKSK
jgi:membrane protein DedA with SNARE-associated domain